MNRISRRLKDKLYYYLVQKNHDIRNEYWAYVRNNQKEHHENRLKSWKLLLKLNYKYRILRKTSMKRRGPKLPYLQGSESKLIKRTPPQHFAKGLLQYDVISFDIFDTLILRPLAMPKDLFMIVGQKLGYNGFSSIRIEAEREVRAHSQLINGTREVSINDFYEYIERKTGIPREKGIRTELETEIEFCFANPYMKRVYDILSAQNKKIIIVSDMYFPASMMEQILNNCGYFGYNDLFVSCDYKCSKVVNGDLYNVVRQTYSKESIVHVGDNLKADINNAKNMGFETRYYKSVHEIGNVYRANGMSELIGSAYAGVVNTYLHNGTKQFDPYYEFGFIYGGLYVLGYCNWIHDYAKKNNIEKIMFLSRDGAIYKRIYDALYDDIPSEYFLWSRIAGTKYLLKNDRQIFLKRNIKFRVLNNQSITVSSMLNSMGLQHLESSLDDWNIHKEEIINEVNSGVIEDFLIDNIDQVIECYDKEVSVAKEYMKKTIGGAKKIAIVDVGWAGSGPLGLKQLIQEWDIHCEVECLVAASGGGLPGDNDINIQTGNLKAYMFSHMNNRNHFDTHFGKNKNISTYIFELFTQAHHPSFSGFDTNQIFTFDIAEVENYEVINQIHQGIEDFVDVYYRTYINHPYMLDISGYDAYCPFRMITRDLSFIKEYFGDFAFAMNTGSDIKNQEVQPFSVIFENKGL